MRYGKSLSIILSSVFGLITICSILQQVPYVAAQAPKQSNPVQPLSNGGLDPDHLLAPALDSKGTDFWLTFPGNSSGGTGLSLFITGDTNTTGTVEITGISFLQNFTVTAGTVTTVPIPSSAHLGTISDTQVNLGIHVTALNEVTVYGLNRVTASTDAYLGLPTDILGTEYVDLGYGTGSELAIVSTANGTVVTITPSVAAGSRAAGVPYNITLNRGRVYQLRGSGGDLSGSFITSNNPVAVYGGHSCTNIPPGYSFCDHIVEQLFPTSTWGKNFVTVPLATRLRGDTFRFLASTNATEVRVNGVVVATLNRGQFHETILTASSHITSDKPILVSQYSNSTSYDGVTSDPFMMLIPPYEQFLAGYTITTPASGFNINYVNVVAPNSTVGNITLDGVAIPATSFSAIGSSGFSGAQVSIALGSHTLASSLPFGAFVYGFASADSYGYPGGLSLSPVAAVTSIDLTPVSDTNPINTQHCVTALVKDQNSNPVVGVRVDFNITGANPTTSFVNTNTAGEAVFCYMGTNLGTDTIVASVGTFSDTATKTWIAAGGFDLSITKTDSIDPVNVGSSLTYTLVVTNNSVVDAPRKSGFSRVAMEATGVTVTDALPPGMTLVNARTSQGTCSGTSTVVCNLGSLQQGGRATVTILVNATQEGVFRNTAIVTSSESDSNSANNTATETTTVSGPTPEVSLSPAGLSFPAQSVGTTSAPQTVTLTNMGTAPLKISSVGTVGDFSVTSNCGTSVAVRGSCPLAVTFKPTARGTRTGTLRITDDAPGSPHTVALSGFGSVPGLTLSRTSVVFASRRVGTTSSAEPVVLTNTGDGPLSLSSTLAGITASGDFTVTDNCGVSVAAGASCRLNIVFAPKATGNRVGVVTIVSDAPGSPHTISLSGIGTGPAVTLSSTSLSFGPLRVGLTSASQSVTLTNSGDSTLILLGISAGGEFGLANNCGSSLPAGGNCNFSATFSPSAVGDRTGQITITSDAPGSPHQVSLSGIGIAPVVALSPASLSFATQRVGTTSALQSVRLTNAGNAPLILGSIVAGAEFGVTQNCGSSLPVGAGCNLDVVFTPLGHGSRTGAITITSDAPDSPHRVGLSGLGSFLALISSLSPTSGPIEGGNFVTITGVNFAAPEAGATSVHFGAEPSPTVTVLNDTTLVARVPAGGGIVPVAVTNSFGRSNAFSYSYVQSSGPTITGLTPAAGSPSGGTLVRIAGRNFISGATVQFGGVPATEVQVLNSMVITAITPSGSGNVAVSVTTSQGTATLPAGFTYTTAQIPGTQLFWFAPEATSPVPNIKAQAPRDLSATRVTAPMVTTGADTSGVPELASYNVYRSTEPIFDTTDLSKAQLIAVVPGGILTWFDPDPRTSSGAVTNRPPLFYKVTALYAGGESDPSNIASPQIAVTGAGLQMVDAKLTLVLEGVSFATFRSFIQINGVTVRQTNFPYASRLGNGTSARIEGIDNFDELVPRGTTASIVVVNPGTQSDLSDAQYSPVFLFKR
jgi:hypothetical protein